MLQPEWMNKAFYIKGKGLKCFFFITFGYLNHSILLPTTCPEGIDGSFLIFLYPNIRKEIEGFILAGSCQTSLDMPRFVDDFDERCS